MPTPLNSQRLENTLRAWEGWVNEVEGAGNDSPEALKALDESRAALLDVLRDAKIVVENPNSARWEYVVGKKLKDLATDIMKKQGVTREVARERILQAIDMIPVFTGSESGRTQSAVPNLTEEERAMKVPHHCELDCTIMPLDHLPEGSH